MIFLGVNVDLEIVARGKAAEAIDTIRRITGKENLIDVVIGALRVYEWCLAQQTLGCKIISEPPEVLGRESIEVVDHVKDRELAMKFFQGRDIFQ